MSSAGRGDLSEFAAEDDDDWAESFDFTQGHTGGVCCSCGAVGGAVGCVVVPAPAPPTCDATQLFFPPHCSMHTPHPHAVLERVWVPDGPPPAADHHPPDAESDNGVYEESWDDDSASLVGGEEVGGPLLAAPVGRIAAV